MLDRFVPILKWTCLVLACLLVYQIARLFALGNSQEFAGGNGTFGAVADGNGQNLDPDTVDSRKSGRDAAPALSPEAKAHVDRIEKSGMFGALPRPLPLALLGIGGKDAFIRTSNGQSGLLRIGEELGGVKLLRIGINQVVVEEDGKEKELQLFPGLGGN